MSFMQRCCPGALVMRDKDKKIGVIVIAKPPTTWFNPETQRLHTPSSWRFEILVGGMLVVTECLGSEYSLVQTW